MPETFVPLTEFLKPRQERESPCHAEPCDPEPREAQPKDDVHSSTEEAFADVRRFRAAIADALDLAVETLLREIAADVLARELRIEPANLRLIVDRACALLAREEPFAVRVHPAEAGSLEGCGLCIVGDAALRRGDAILELRSGTVDVSLGARLEAVLAACTR
jgi:flagellar biosynthesis/type III secretory pathway protein FliH